MITGMYAHMLTCTSNEKVKGETGCHPTRSGTQEFGGSVSHFQIFLTGVSDYHSELFVQAWKRCEVWKEPENLYPSTQFDMTMLKQC